MTDNKAMYDFMLMAVNMNFLRICSKFAHQGFDPTSLEYNRESHLRTIFREGLGSASEYEGLQFDFDYSKNLRDLCDQDLKVLEEEMGDKPYIIYYSKDDLSRLEQFDCPKVYSRHYETDNKPKFVNFDVD